MPRPDRVATLTAAVLFFAFSWFFFFRGQALLAVITAIAFTAYCVLSMDPKKDKIRYADWVLTTPLLLIALFYPRATPMDLLPVVAADVLMIATGWLAHTARTKTERNVLFGISCYFFLVVFGLVFSMRPPLGAAVFLFLTFLIYPVIWMMYETGTIRYPVYTGTIAGLDVFSKIGLGLILAV